MNTYTNTYTISRKGSSVTLTNSEVQDIMKIPFLKDILNQGYLTTINIPIDYSKIKILVNYFTKKSKLQLIDLCNIYQIGKKYDYKPLIKDINGYNLRNITQQELDTLLKHSEFIPNFVIDIILKKFLNPRELYNKKYENISYFLEKAFEYPKLMGVFIKNIHNKNNSSFLLEMNKITNQKHMLQFSKYIYKIPNIYDIIEKQSEKDFIFLVTYYYCLETYPKIPSSSKKLINYIHKHFPKVNKTLLFKWGDTFESKIMEWIHENKVTVSFLLKFESKLDYIISYIKNNFNRFEDSDEYFKDYFKTYIMDLSIYNKHVEKAFKSKKLDLQCLFIEYTINNLKMIVFSLNVNEIILNKIPFRECDVWNILLYSLECNKKDWFNWVIKWYNDKEKEPRLVCDSKLLYKILSQLKNKPNNPITKIVIEKILHNSECIKMLEDTKHCNIMMNFLTESNIIHKLQPLAKLYAHPILLHACDEKLIEYKNMKKKRKLR